MIVDKQLNPFTSSVFQNQMNNYKSLYVSRLQKLDKVLKEMYCCCASVTVSKIILGQLIFCKIHAMNETKKVEIIRGGGFRGFIFHMFN